MLCHIWDTSWKRKIQGWKGNLLVWDHIQGASKMPSRPALAAKLRFSSDINFNAVSLDVLCSA